MPQIPWRARAGVVTPVLLLMLGAPLGAQRQPDVHQAPSPIGMWRGTSLCLVRPSPCNDEIVVYRITRANASDSLSFDARKIVNGLEEEMGVLGCRFQPASAQVACGIRNGMWRFTVRGDSLTGELRLPNGTKYRDVRTARAR
jgi:hypothetical protein